MSRRMKFAAAVMLTSILMCQEVKAAEITVAAVQEVLYSCEGAAAYASPDFNAAIITKINPNLPIAVVGVTSNGWYQINLGQIYYVPGNALSKTASAAAAAVVYDDAAIRKLTSGTFSFYNNAELRAFTKEEVADMTHNDYIKYLDSFIIGNAMIDYCIIQETGLTLKAEYDTKAITAMTSKEYLITYRNSYLEDSFWGPVKSAKELKVNANRAIRYGINSFSTVYQNASVGSDKNKMEKVMSSLKAEIKSEQGVTFDYKMSYGSYQTEEGREASGWIIEFTKSTK